MIHSDCTDANADVVGKKITIIGAARSGIAAAQLAARHGAQVFVSDREPAKNLAPHIAQLESLRIPFETGSHSERVFDCDLMVISPGVPSAAPVVIEAQQRGIEIVSELELASWFCEVPIIAVTGSNGKTTTTTLIGRMLGDARIDHAVGGNIGTAFSAVIGGLRASSVAVLEVSSFQLDFCRSFRPKVSVLLNITADHMDRYDNSMEKYSSSKSRIFMNQTGEDVLVYNHDDEWCRLKAQHARCRKLPFGIEQQFETGAFVDGGHLVTAVGGKRCDVIATDQITIPGMHNVYNSMAAALAAQMVGVNISSIRSTLRNFKGVEHRLELVRELGSVRFVDDSKATNVDSVWYALQAFDAPIILLLGGRDKGNDYSKLFALVQKRVRAIIAIGESAQKVADAFRDKVPVEIVPSMSDDVPNRVSLENAVRRAKARAEPGDVVLLSPACASFDWFHNYEERGEIFKNIVGKLS